MRAYANSVLYREIVHTDENAISNAYWNKLYPTRVFLYTQNNPKLERHDFFNWMGDEILAGRVKMQKIKVLVSLFLKSLNLCRLMHGKALPSDFFIRSSGQIVG